MKPINIVGGVDGGGAACVDCSVSGGGCMKNAASHELPRQLFYIILNKINRII
jgi:hypothetical protein